MQPYPLVRRGKHLRTCPNSQNEKKYVSLDRLHTAPIIWKEATGNAEVHTPDENVQAR